MYIYLFFFLLQCWSRPNWHIHHYRLHDGNDRSREQDRCIQLCKQHEKAASIYGASTGNVNTIKACSDMRRETAGF